MSRGSKPDGSCLRIDEWPEADRVAWRAAQQPRDPLEPKVGYASRWKPSTQKLIEAGYGSWLAWAATAGLLAEGSTAASRTTSAHVRAYLDMLEASGLAPYTIALRMQNLGNALRAIAPDQEWERVLRASGRIHCRATPTRDRAAILQPAEDVLMLGHDMMHAAEHDQFGTARDRATLFRDGLIITVLVHRPLRSRNFHSLRIGKELHRQAETWFLAIDKSETKSGNYFATFWPVALAQAMEHYISVHRPALLASSRKNLPPTDILWISNHGTPMTASAIAFQVKSRTEVHFGKPINPHSFRHLAATTIATANPEGVMDIQGVLGHASPAAGEKYYNKAKMVDAGRRYQQTLDSWGDEP